MLCTLHCSRVQRPARPVVTAAEARFSCCEAMLRAACVQGEGEEEETDELVSQVLDEIGVNLGSDLVGVPGKQAQAAKQVRPELPTMTHLSASLGSPWSLLPVAEHWRLR